MDPRGQRPQGEVLLCKTESCKTAGPELPHPRVVNMWPEVKGTSPNPQWCHPVLPALESEAPCHGVSWLLGCRASKLCWGDLCLAGPSLQNPIPPWPPSLTALRQQEVCGHRISPPCIEKLLKLFLGKAFHLENTQISIQSLKRFTWTLKGNSLSWNFGHWHVGLRRGCAYNASVNVSGERGSFLPFPHPDELCRIHNSQVLRKDP